MPVALQRKDETIRFVLPSDLKARFIDKCGADETTMSERMRQLVAADVEQDNRERSFGDRFRAITRRAAGKIEAGGIASPSLDDIDAFIDEVRGQRIEQGRLA